MATVLIVDDDSNNRLLLASLLKFAGHAILEAENGAVGLQLATQHVPDLAIVDLNMPEIDGVAFVRTVRQDTSLQNVRLALSTGTILNAAMQDFLELYGVATIIPKPAEPEEILRLIDAALS